MTVVARLEKLRDDMIERSDWKKCKTIPVIPVHADCVKYILKNVGFF